MHLWLTPGMSSRLDKLNLMFFSAAMMLSFLFMSPDHVPYCTSTSSECKRVVLWVICSHVGMKWPARKNLLIALHTDQGELHWLGLAAFLSASVLLTQQFSQNKRQYQKQEQYWLALTCQHFYSGDRSCHIKDPPGMLIFFWPTRVWPKLYADASVYLRETGSC